MNDFSITSQFKKWIHRSNLYVICFIVLANFLHLGIFFVGLKKINKLLRVLLKPSQKAYFLSKKETFLLAANTKSLIRDLRKRKWVFCNCLSSSLALWMMFYYQGLTTDIMIGCNNKGTFKAHAWVELHNIPLTKRLNTEYLKLNYSFSLLNF